MTFADALTYILAAEGGYVDHPNDPGGRTNFGITEAVYRAWLRERGLPMATVRDIPMAHVERIYRTRYWIPAKCPDLPWPISLIHFDGAVNHGVTAGARILQRAVGATVDGIIGPKTLGAVASHDPRQLAYRLLWERTDFYRGICNRRSGSRVFLLGWLNRLDKVRQSAGL